MGVWRKGIGGGSGEARTRIEGTGGLTVVHLEKRLESAAQLVQRGKNTASSHLCK